MSPQRTLLAILATTALAAACAQGDARATDSLHTASSAAPAPAAAPALDDPTIVAIFDAANTADIETGELAMQRGHAKEVRDFGAMLARDHKAVRQQGRDLAAKLGVTPTPPSDDASARAHADAMASLRTKSGADFDRAFLAHEVEFHRSVLDAVEKTLLPAIANAEVKELVVKVAPAFRAHMMAAENLGKQIAQAGAAK